MTARARGGSSDAVVVGSGPNGLAAAIVLARAGVSVTVFEAGATLGGGLRSAPLTLPGFMHDVCAAVFPMAVVSPFFRELSAPRSRLEWRYPPISVAHPFLDGTAAVISPSITATAASLGGDGPAYARVFSPLIAHADALWPELLQPLHVPRHPALLLRFAADARRSAIDFARHHFREERAQALFAGCAAHASLPLSGLASAAVGMVLATTGHTPGWPHPVGGAQRVAEVLVERASSLGVTFVRDRRIDSIEQLPPARATLFDVAPIHLAEIARTRLPAAYRERLCRYRYGPSAFKVDWALSAPIPWRAEACRSAATVHVGGTLEEVAHGEAMLWEGKMPDEPFVLVAQPSLVDPSRAPAGGHTGWAYAHVPFAWEGDVTDAIERRVEAFAPGFRDTILARSVLSPAALERRNANDVGGHILGGASDLPQLFARPVSAWAPYSTPDPAIFLCSASTPPGAGVHGMCGYNAAKAVLRRRFD